MATNQQATAYLFIGADNTTGAVDLETIDRIMSERHSGYTVLPAQGVWEGAHEDSVMVIVSDSRAVIAETARALCQKLNQEAVAIQWLPPMELVTSATLSVAA